MSGIPSASPTEAWPASPHRPGVIDSQSVKTTEFSGPYGYDAGNKVKGRKRHIFTDTIGLPVRMIMHPADVQDRDGAPDLLTRVRSLYPWLSHILADRGYTDDKLKDVPENLGDWTIEVVKRPDVTKDFILLPRRACLCLAEPQLPPG